MQRTDSRPRNCIRSIGSWHSPKCSAATNGEALGGGSMRSSAIRRTKCYRSRNPPIDPTDLKRFVTANPSIPAVRGKQNLYKLFVCRAWSFGRWTVRLHRADGMLLGDDSPSNVRRHMITSGEFASVEAFPHKDNPKKRVFKDAKLSTAVFSSSKSTNGERPGGSRAGVLDGNGGKRFRVTGIDHSRYSSLRSG